METRVQETLGVEPSLLGFGCMRFPTLEGGAIDEEQALAMLDRAWEGGVNYFDTAYFYHNGKSEEFMGRALARYPRERYYLTSKLPTTLIHSLDDAKRIYAEQRARLQTEYLDFYLLHNLNGARWREMVAAGVVDWCLERQAAGEFRHFGFSFHGSYEEFHEILTARRWDCCQIQLNYMDTETQAGLKGYRLTEELGVPLIIMEPVKGGALASPPPEVMDLFAPLRPGASASSWALRWAASLPNVMTVLSGMSTMVQVEDNLATFQHFQPLSGTERAAVDRAAECFRQKVRNGCTGCQYCMPCPAGVDIPGLFQVWNEYAMFQNRDRARAKWKDLDEEERPHRCVSCGACEEKCPQSLPIRADLLRAGEELERL
ncbi:aldo/keto reductase [Intestinimonas sp.]|uniref:aldo/keto reductase n=1 Tax=Intestinimonas sp. TaxID=1965293 RepID=UPI00262FEE21|nr:aldo/keto reductase [Intestinimonas sp.]